MIKLNFQQSKFELLFAKMFLASELPVTPKNVPQGDIDTPSGSLPRTPEVLPGHDNCNKEKRKLKI